MTRLTLPFHAAYSAPHFLSRSFQNCIGRWRNAAFLVVTALAFSLDASAASGNPSCQGVSLPSGSKKMEGDAKECRFVSSINWDETIKFFERGLPSSTTRWHKEVNIPAAKYRHVENTQQKSTWEGLNIYQVGGDPNGEVRMFVIPKPQEPKKVSKDASKKSEKSDKSDKKEKKDKKKSK